MLWITRFRVGIPFEMESDSCKVLYCSEPYIITLPSSQYNLNKFDRDVKHQLIIIIFSKYIKDFPLKLAMDDQTSKTLSYNHNKKLSPGGYVLLLLCYVHVPCGAFCQRNIDNLLKWSTQTKLLDKIAALPIYGKIHFYQESFQARLNLHSYTFVQGKC